MLKDCLDLIHRLQAKNERLTEELNDTISMNEMYVKTVRQNAELQKQVDELKQENSILSVTVEMHDEVEQQAVKDTAKEIWNRAYKIACNTRGEITEQSIKEIAKREYGVEVE